MVLTNDYKILERFPHMKISHIIIIPLHKLSDFIAIKGILSKQQQQQKYTFGICSLNDDIAERIL